jgi:Concanavalin A-like lectin/glucanases superfamily
MSVHHGGRGPGHLSRSMGGSAGDPYSSSVVLLAGFEGTDGSTTLVDESPVGRTLTAQSTAQIDTAQFKYGASSLLLNGTSDYVTAADSTDWDFGSGEFTIEAFTRWSSLSNDAAIAANYDGTNGWSFGVSSGFLTFNGTSYTFNDAGWWFANRVIDQWFHFCADRDASGHTRIYIDGVMRGKSTNTAAINNATGNLAIGRRAEAAIRYFPGHIDELRITKGIARYASDSGFTVPTEAYPRA